jgi:uncharacterized membrane protein YcaP (DUF421 family)
MRFWGKKHLDEVTLFDFILLLLISEVIQNSLVDDDKGLPDGLTVFLTFLFWNALVNRLTHRYPRLEALLMGRPEFLLKDGRVIEAVKVLEHITDQELMSALQEEGIDDVSKVKQATIETNGHITVLH